jgi:predicted ATPase/DNA-binding winged helix-turn-helix (wHTH) protein
MNEPLDAMRGANVLRFGTFELDAACGELRRRGLRVHLQEMPLQVLLMLLERPGELVRRDDFYTRLWPNDALGILDDNLNTAVAKLRVALDDSARNPRFIETVPRRGYRFVAPVNGHARARADVHAIERPADEAASHAAAPATTTEVDGRVRTASSTAESKREPELRRIGSLFVGREREMEQLRDALRDSGSGRRYVVLAAGEAGIGKTRLAEQLGEEADEIGTRVVWGRSLEEHGGQPYWPWVQILRSLIESSPDDVLREDMGASAGDIARIVPELSARLGVRPPETLANAEQDRFRLFDSIAEYLRRAARRRPLMLVFDSLHWAGRPSLLLLEFVAQSLADSALLIFGSYRASEVTREHPLFHTLGTLNRESRFVRLQLRGLSVEATAELVGRASGAPWPAQLVEAIQRQTEGNPFFVSEVAQLLVEEQVLERRGDGMQPAAGRALVVRIPEGIREVIGKRLVRLSGNCNTMLSHAAVAGREFDLDVLRLLMQELDEDALLEALEEALACGAIEEAQPQADRYRFTHALIKETLYDEISPAQRARRHARVGDALERLRSADLAPHLSQIAHQYARAAGSGRAAQAVDYCTRAGEQAESLRAYEEAAAHYQMGLDALKHE